MMDILAILMGLGIGEVALVVIVAIIVFVVLTRKRVR
jgi:hypothetical protein